MAKEDEKTDGEETSTDLEKKLSQLSEDVKGAVENAREQSVLAQLMANPQVREAILAAQQGKRVKVVEEGGTPPQPKAPPVPDKDPEDMTNAEILALVQKQTAATVSEVVAPQLQPLMDQLKAIQASTEQQMVEKAKGQVQAAEAKYPDFGKHRETMVKINRENPNLSVEELYMLAKVRAGEPLTPPKTSSERPTSSTARVGGKVKARPPGLVGFNEALQEALSSLELKTEDE
jgi:hypothetical protein